MANFEKWLAIRGRWVVNNFDCFVLFFLGKRSVRTTHRMLNILENRFIFPGKRVRASHGLLNFSVFSVGGSCR